MSLLRPGLHVVRRDERHLQVGVDPPWRVVVPDEPAVVAVLDDLAAGREPAPTTLAARRVLHDLGRAGLLRPPAQQPHGRVAVSGSAALVTEALRLLSGHTTERVERADVALVLTAGEPARGILDDHVRAGRPHLPVSADAAGYRIGPFVDPGATACLRCVDAHLGEHDPRRAVVVEQLAGRPAAPDDPLLASLAVTWAAREVLRHLAGAEPVTWSATIDLPLDGGPVRRTWARHPYCGCSWAEGLG